MQVPSQLTYTAGSPLLATDMNSDVRDAIQFLLAPPMFFGYLAADVVATSAASFGVDRGLTEAFDNDGMHAGTDAFITIQTPGKYDVMGWGTMEANATGTRGVRVMLNGAVLTMTRIRASEAGTWADDCSLDNVDLEIGDVLAVNYYQNSGVNLNVIGGTGPYASGMSVRWVGLGD